jgi:hypothetical protein
LNLSQMSWQAGIRPHVAEVRGTTDCSCSVHPQFEDIGHHPGVIEPTTEDQIRQLTRAIASDYGSIGVDEIEATTRKAFEELSARSKAPAFVGILTERRVRRQLSVGPTRRSA